LELPEPIGADLGAGHAPIFLSAALRGQMLNVGAALHDIDLVHRSFGTLRKLAHLASAPTLDAWRSSHVHETGREEQSGLPPGIDRRL
jgi:hypothetical protein